MELHEVCTTMFTQQDIIIQNSKISRCLADSKNAEAFALFTTHAPGKTEFCMTLEL